MDTVQYAQNDGVLLVGAAGGSGPCTDCVSYPAAAVGWIRATTDEPISTWGRLGFDLHSTEIQLPEYFK